MHYDKKQVARGSSKTDFIRHLLEQKYIQPDSKILDMGSGASTAWIELFDTHPNIQYVGIEPNQKSLQKAQDYFGSYSNTSFKNDFAYSEIEGFGNFDLCISLSVLEHVKQLKTMLQKSIEAVKPGGYIIHWYDLGHALHPSSFKERLHVFFGNNMKFMLSERNFVQYACPKTIQHILEENGADVLKVSNHQARSVKSCLKNSQTDEDYRTILELSQWEFDHQDIIQRIPKKEREDRFPSIVVWAQKKK